MATLTPFRALRPPADLAARVASPPYDVVSTRRRARSRRATPTASCACRGPEIDLPEGTDEHADAVYAKGAREPRRARPARRAARRTPSRASTSTRSGWARTGRPGSSRARRSTSTTATSSRSTRRRARTRRTTGSATSTRSRRTTSRCSSPTAPSPEIDRAIEEVKRAAPEVGPRDAGRRRPPALGRAAAIGARIEALFARVPALYVADGHHRSAAASRVHATRARPAAASTAPSSRSSSPTTRCRSSRTTGSCAIRAAGGRARSSARSAKVMDVEPGERAAAGRGPLAFGVFVGGRWYHARVRPGSSRREGSGRVARLRDRAGPAPRADLRHRRPAHLEGRRLRRRDPRPRGARAARDARRGGRSRSTSSRRASSSSSRSPTRGSSCRRRARGSSRSCARACSCTRSSASRALRPSLGGPELSVGA